MNQLSKLDLKLLRSADALLIERDVELAARRLDLPTQDLQHDLSRLRELLDDPVLVRSDDEWVLTRRAGAIARSLPQLLLQMTRLFEATPFVPRLAQGRIRMSIADAGRASIAPALASRMLGEAPGVRFDLRISHGQTLVELERGITDIAINVATPVPDTLHRCEIGRDQLLCGLRPGHALLSAPWSLDEYVSAAHLAVGPADGAAAVVDMALAAQGLRRQVVARVPSMELAVALAMQNDLVITGPSQSFGGDGLQLVLCEPPLALPPLLLNMVWGERAQHDPLCAWIRSMVLEISESM